MTIGNKTPGEIEYERFWAKKFADPEFARIYEEEAAKKELWLQLIEARLAAGLSQSQMAERLVPIIHERAPTSDPLPVRLSDSRSGVPASRSKTRPT